MRTALTKILNLVIILTLPILLSSCAVYSSGFTCPDARGAKCVMLSEVDHMVDSGEIETVYAEKKCKGGKCKSTANVPQKAFTEIHKIKIESASEYHNSDNGDIQYQDGEYLYVK